MSIKLKKLIDQTIVVTGATSGIGLVTVRLAAKRGAKLLLVARTDESLRKLANELRENGAVAEYVVTDVRDPRQVRRVAEVALEKFGGFDTWVNNAAVSIYGKIEDVSLEDHHKAVRHKLLGPGARLAGRR